jgi:S1-C subfamily serine protease
VAHWLIRVVVESNTAEQPQAEAFYVGYSFAVPSNITRKIIEDLMEFGNVQEFLA